MNAAAATLIAAVITAVPSACATLSSGPPPPPTPVVVLPAETRSVTRPAPVTPSTAADGGAKVGDVYKTGFMFCAVTTQAKADAINAAVAAGQTLTSCP